MNFCLALIKELAKLDFFLDAMHALVRLEKLVAYLLTLLVTRVTFCVLIC